MGPFENILLYDQRHKIIKVSESVFFTENSWFRKYYNKDKSKNLSEKKQLDKMLGTTKSTNIKIIWKRAC